MTQTTIEAIAAIVDNIESEHADPRTGRLLKSMLDTCINLARAGTRVADLKLVDAALGEIHAALACFQAHPHSPKVTVFGSARTQPEAGEYRLAQEFSRAIADAGFMVITGAGPGIMQAAQEGAGRARSFGVNIRLPFENTANSEIRDDPKLVEFKYFFTRKLFFLKESAAVALFPGGFGTHDECFETLTLVQTGKSQMVPIVFLDVPNGTYWKTWDQYVHDHLLRKGLISTEDLALYKITDDLNEAVGEITNFYRVYHSSRTIRNNFVIRTNEALSDTRLEELSREFADILDGRPIFRRDPFDEESDEPETAKLARIVLNFDMRSYGRLRRLIDRINDPD